MAEKRNARNVVDYDKPIKKLPSYRLKVDPEFVKNIVHVDADVVPGAEFFNEARWIVPGAAGEIKLTEAHTHHFGVLMGFFGFNYEDIQDLGAEIEITIDNQTHKVTKSFASFVPAGVHHGPIIVRNVKRPIFHFIAADTDRFE